MSIERLEPCPVICGRRTPVNRNGSNYILFHLSDDRMMMEAAGTSKTLADFFQTAWRYIPESSYLQMNLPYTPIFNMRFNINVQAAG
jgi:hypothetical protein